MWENFDDFLKKQNIDSVDNIDFLFDKDIPEEERQKLIGKIKSFYKDKSFTRDNFIALVKKNPKYFNQRILEWVTPEIEMWSENDENVKKIIAEVETRFEKKEKEWWEQSPKDLVLAIAETIKNHMKFDFITSLLTFWISVLNFNAEISPEFINILRNNEISEESYKTFKDYLQKTIDTKDTAIGKWLLSIFKFMIWTKNKEEFKEYILGNLDSIINSGALAYISWLGYKDIVYKQYEWKQTVNDYFSLGVWEQKHFVSIMYTLYKKIWPKHFPNTQMSQVLSPKDSYNLLTYSKNWAIINQYIDIADFMLWGKLFVDKKIEKQVLLSKNWDTSNLNIS